MNEWTNERMNKWANEWANKWMHRFTQWLQTLNSVCGVKKDMLYLALIYNLFYHYLTWYCIVSLAQTGTVWLGFPLAPFFPVCGLQHPLASTKEGSDMSNLRFSSLVSFVCSILYVHLICPHTLIIFTACTAFCQRDSIREAKGTN